MSASRLLWFALIPLLLVNAVLWAVYPHLYLVSAIWLGLAIAGKRLFLNDHWNYK